MDDEVPNEENPAGSNKVAPEILSGQVETATGPGPMNLYYGPPYVKALGSSGETAQQYRITQILFFVLLSVASVFGLMAFLLLLCVDSQSYKRDGLHSMVGLDNPIIHQIVMILFAVELQGFAILVYRIIPCWSIKALKLIHFALHAIVAFFMLIGLISIIFLKWGHEQDHFTTQHSWSGIISFSCFILQFGAAAGVFLPPIIPVCIRAALMPFHKAIGWLIYLTCCITALLGISSINKVLQYETEKARRHAVKKAKHANYTEHVHHSVREHEPKQMDDGLLVRFAFLFLLFHVVIMLYLVLAPQFRRRPRPSM